MKNVMRKNQKIICPSCGAPVVSEICAYCGRPTGLRTTEADTEYPVLECKEVTMNSWTVGFPLIFAVMFGVAAALVLTMAFGSFGRGFGNGFLVVMSIPFLLIGVVASFLALRPLLCYVKVKKYGKKIGAVVYGYVNDNIFINGRPAQVVKLLVQTQRGPRFIFYQMGNTVKMYGINDKINILVYKNYFMICKDEKTIRW